MSQQQNAQHGPSGNQVRKATVGRGLLTLAAAVVVVGSFVALNHALAIADVWVGFLFALYWAGLERSNFSRLPDCVAGAAVGLTAAYGLHALPAALGNAALLPCIAGVIILMYFQIMGWCAVAVNMSTMLFLTVATIPSIQASGQYQQQISALLLGALYFATVVWIANRIARRFAQPGPLAST